MPSTRGQLGTATSREEDDSEDSGGGEEQPPASLDSVLTAIATVQKKLEQQDDRFVALEQNS